MTQQDKRGQDGGTTTSFMFFMLSECVSRMYYFYKKEI